jgi:hypothetical protein
MFGDLARVFSVVPKLNAVFGSTALRYFFNGCSRLHARSAYIRPNVYILYQVRNSITRQCLAERPNKKQYFSEKATDTAKMPVKKIVEIPLGKIWLFSNCWLFPSTRVISERD